MLSNQIETCLFRQLTEEVSTRLMPSAFLRYEWKIPLAVAVPLGFVCQSVRFIQFEQNFGIGLVLDFWGRRLIFLCTHLEMDSLHFVNVLLMGLDAESWKFRF